jgi:hypothetical protein
VDVLGQQEGLPAEGLAFMQFRKPLLSTFDPTKPDKAFATPRTWEKALTYYADGAMPEHIKQASMAGAVGEGPSAEFWGFVDVWGKMPKMSDIEANPDKVPVPEEAAMRYAVSVAISGTMNPRTSAPFATYLQRWTPSSVSSAGSWRSSATRPCAGRRSSSTSRRSIGRSSRAKGFVL